MSFVGNFVKHFFKKEQTEGTKRVVAIHEELYTLRFIQHTDIKGLLALEKKVYQGKLPWTRSAFLQELNSFFPHLYLLLEQHQQIVGFIGCRIQNEDAHLTHIAILPEKQSYGLGSFLLSEVKRFALQKNCQTMSLEVRLSNLNAQRLYRRFGFVSSNIKKNYYTQEKEDGLEMIYDLYS